MQLMSSCLPRIQLTPYASIHPNSTKKFKFALRDEGRPWLKYELRFRISGLAEKSESQIMN